MVERNTFKKLLCVALILIAILSLIIWMTRGQNPDELLKPYTDGELTLEESTMIYTLSNNYKDYKDAQTQFANNSVLALNTLVLRGKEELANELGVSTANDIDSVIVIMNQKESKKPMYLGFYYWKDLKKASFTTWQKNVKKSTKNLDHISPVVAFDRNMDETLGLMTFGIWDTELSNKLKEKYPAFKRRVDNMNQ